MSKAPTLLDAAAIHLQSLLHQPRANLQTSLTNLLARYSTGLSLSVALDELKTDPPPPASKPILDATIVTTCDEAPQLWLIRLEKGDLHVLHVHSVHRGRFPPGARFSFLASPLRKVADSSVCEHLRLLAVRALRAEKEGVKGVDDGKKSVRFTQDCTRLSQSDSQNDGVLEGVRSVYLPTEVVVFDAQFMEGGFEEREVYTLQRVWNERNLAPDLVTGHVVSIEGGVIRVADRDGLANQPSVEWILEEGQMAFSDIVEKGDQVFLDHALINPTGCSFTLHTGPKTTVYRRGAKCVARAEKRRRTMEPNDEMAMKDVSQLSPHGRVGSVYALVTGRPIVGKNGVEMMSGTTSVWIVGGHDVRKGDELVLRDVQWCVDNGSGCEWRASSFYNLSAMTGVLYCPFVRCISSVGDLDKMDGMCVPTAHVWMMVTKVVVMRELEYLLLSVMDANGGEGRGRVILKERGFGEIFRMRAEEFWKRERPLRQVEKEKWMCAITRGQVSESGLGEVAACVRG